MMRREQRPFNGVPGAALFAAAAVIMLNVHFTHAEEKMAFLLTSTAFNDGGQIPSRYTCEGRDISPPLAWAGVPDQARSLVLIVDDPDAPDPAAPRMTWVHWVLYNISAESSGLSEGAGSGKLSPEIKQGLNDWKRTGYGGPCPPIGRHRYVHKLYALDTVLPELNHPRKDSLEKAMAGHVLAETRLVGTYQKSK